MDVRYCSKRQFSAASLRWKDLIHGFSNLKGLASRECAGSTESYLEIIARFNRYKLDGCKNYTQDSLMPAWMRQMPLSAVI